MTPIMTLSNYIKESLTTGLQPNPTIFTVVKPGFLDKTQQIIEMFKREGWTVRQMRTTRLTYKQAAQLYISHKKEDFYKDLCEYMSSDRSTAIIYERTIPHDMNQKDVFKKVEVLKDIIRDKWGLTPCKNVLHSSDSFSAMENEKTVYF